MITVNHFVNDCPNFKFLPLFPLRRSSLEVRVQILHLGLKNVYTWACSCEHFPGCTRTFWCGECPSMHQSGLSFPFVLPSLWPPFFLFHCRLFIWNQHCLRWKTFFWYFSVSRGMRLWKTDLSQHPYFICVYTSRIRVYTRDSLSRSSGVCTSFFPGSHLSVSRTLQGLRVTRRVLSHRYATSLDETACASLHLRNKKIRWRAFIQIFSLERLGVSRCDTTQNSFFYNINTTEFRFRYFGFRYFWNNVFPYACSSSQILVNASGHMWSGRDVVWISINLT